MVRGVDGAEDFVYVRLGSVPTRYTRVKSLRRTRATRPEPEPGSCQEHDHAGIAADRHGYGEDKPVRLALHDVSYRSVTGHDTHHEVVAQHREDFGIVQRSSGLEVATGDVGRVKGTTG